MGERPPHPERLGSLTRRIGTLRHFSWLRGVIFAILGLNVVDAILTLVWIQSGQAEEANPFMADLAHDHPILFVATKFTLVGLGALLLWRLRKRKLAVIAIFVAFLAYYYVLLYHLSAMNIRLLDRLFG